MKIAVVYNRDSKSVINLFGIPNRERYGRESIQRIVNALKDGGHQVISLEGDKDLVDRLEDFMPRVLEGERPGMVFNLSYGIQGQSRYTHVPGILEMVGIPYVGSGPLAHSLALDKVVAKMIFRQNGLPTPDFAVLQDRDFQVPDLPFPLIVKPKNEAVSFGLRVVENEAELREAADRIFERYQQPVLVEQYIDGREINVGLLGNQPPEAFAPAELSFGEGGPRIYTLEDKTRQSGREIRVICPAPLDAEATEKAQDLARKAFNVLGCYDCARVDMRMAAEGSLHILEINSLPSLGEHGSYVAAAAEAGLDFTGLVNRLVEVASARYFGTPLPVKVSPKDADPATMAFTFLTQRRDQIERRVQEWTRTSSRTSDPVGIRANAKERSRKMREVGLRPVPAFTNDKSVWTWETERGYEGGTLLVAHLDVPLDAEVPGAAYRRDPEWLYGEGIGSTHAPMAMLEFSLRALRYQRRLRRRPIGVLFHADEGRDCRYSGDRIREAAAKAKHVLVLRPGGAGDTIVHDRRGQRKFQLVIEGKSNRIGSPASKGDVLRWAFGRLEEMAGLSSRKDRLAVSVVDARTQAFPLYVPHRVTLTVILSYADLRKADEAEARMRGVLKHDRYRSRLEQVSDRPSMKVRSESRALLRSVLEVARKWEIPLSEQSSLWPSAGGLVPEGVGVLCGLGPVAVDLHTPREAVQRISLLQRTLLLTQYLLRVDGK